MQEPNRTKLRERATGINGAPRVNSLHTPSPPLPSPSRIHTRAMVWNFQILGCLAVVRALRAIYLSTLSLLLSPNQPSSLLPTIPRKRHRLIRALFTALRADLEDLDDRRLGCVYKSSGSSGSGSRCGSAITIPAHIGRDVAKFEAAS